MLQFPHEGRERPRTEVAAGVLDVNNSSGLRNTQRLKQNCSCNVRCMNLQEGEAMCWQCARSLYFLLQCRKTILHFKKRANFLAD